MHCLICLKNDRITYVSTGLPECIYGHSVTRQDVVEETKKYKYLLAKKKDAQLNPIREYIQREKRAKVSV